MSVQETGHFVALFESVSGVMKSEKILKARGVPFKIIPIPRSMSSDCGVCIRFDAGVRDQLVLALDGR